MRKLNVMLAIEELETGGAEKIFTAIAGGLDRSLFRVYVTCLRKPGVLAREVGDNCDGFFVLGKKRKLDIGTVARFVRLLREMKVDILNTHLVTANTWGRVAGAIARTPAVVATEHSADDWKGPLQRKIDRLLVPLTTRLVAVSGSVARFYERRIGVPRGRMIIIRNGIEASEWKPRGVGASVRSKLGIPPGAPVVGTVGRLIPDKKQDTLIEFARDFPDWRVVIVGEGPLENHLREKAASCGVEGRVVLTGLRRDVRDLMESFDAFALPSRREGLSIVLIEAMAMGLPVVVTDVGGNRELVEHNVDGIVSYAGSAGLFGYNLRRVLESPDLARRLGAAAREKVRRCFRVETMVRAYENLFLERFGRGGRGCR